ncbi:pentatricopeptide repeat-containing At3g05240 [Olea europaea subsp. europaea]|uniref:Pentatricopeptide repeat-containing At3g05240 n=1 Tax=Olea europaea subsp. europaea TaxID=158383 RepID=A0A8S0UH17_OLEEU|nr:pentatricopeptide repeat-containing At3g05240 [Olea europaea subsp. europaea]
MLKSSWRAYSRLSSNSRQLTEYFLSTLPLCRRIQDLKTLKSLLIVHGLITHQPLIKQFIDHCCHLSFLELALSTFKIIEKPSLPLQNLLTRSLCDNRLFDHVLFVYQKCRGSGCLSDNYTYPFVLKACSALVHVNFGKTIHSAILRTGFEENVVIQTALIDFYSNVGGIVNARELIDRITHPDLVAWNALISGYSFNGFDREVFKVFQEIRNMDFKPNVSTLASVIPVCLHFGVHIGYSLHGFAFKCGYSTNESLVPAFISLYGNSGELLAARNIFESLMTKNVAVWNAMISAYSRNQKSYCAVELFQRMLLDDPRPNIVTFVSVIPSCENHGSIFLLESFHACVIKSGFERHISVVTALLSVYAKLQHVNSAEYLFKTTTPRNLLSWNSMVSAYVSNGLWDAGLIAFRQMQMAGFNPDSISIISILSLCSEKGAALPGKSAHAFSLKHGNDVNLNASNALLAFYCDCRELAYSCKIFMRMIEKNLVSWNTMISGCVDNGEAEQAMAFFRQMRQEGFHFDMITLISILPSCNECENLALGLTVHGYAVKTALTADISLANALISMYINCGELDAGCLLFEYMPNKTVISWNALMTGYRYHDLQSDIIFLFTRMVEENQKPNYVTLLNVLPACCSLLQGKSVHAYAFRTGIALKTPLLTSLMIMYARFEDVSSCLMLFHMGEKRNISVWNAVITAHLRSNNARTAFSFFLELLRREIEPDVVTILNLISTCLQLNNQHLTDSILAYLFHKSFDKDVAISNALIDLYAKCGSLSSARMLFDALPQKDTFSWTVMINGYGVHGDGEAALELFSQMRTRGFKPDKITYMSILSSCSHAGLVEQGKTIFSSMIQEGILPGNEHCACMVDLLGRTGNLNEAYELIQNLPQKPSANILESLLGACLSHGDYGVGEEIGSLLLQMKPEDSTPYVILYNVYAAAGKWTDASRVRLEMEQKQIRKIAGFSTFDCA